MQVHKSVRGMESICFRLVTVELYLGTHFIRCKCVKASTSFRDCHLRANGYQILFWNKHLPIMTLNNMEGELLYISIWSAFPWFIACQITHFFLTEISSKLTFQSYDSQTFSFLFPLPTLHFAQLHLHWAEKLPDWTFLLFKKKHTVTSVLASLFSLTETKHLGKQANYLCALAQSQAHVSRHFGWVGTCSITWCPSSTIVRKGTHIIQF